MHITFKKSRLALAVMALSPALVFAQASTVVPPPLMPGASAPVVQAPMAVSSPIPAASVAANEPAPALIDIAIPAATPVKQVTIDDPAPGSQATSAPKTASPS